MSWISSNTSWLTPLVSMLAGAGIVRYMFFSVNKNERGVWLRLGNPVYRRDGTLSIMRNGRPGVRPPWVYHLIKVDVAIRTTSTDDMEMVRKLENDGRESWKATGEFLWQVLDDQESYIRAIFSTKDMDAALEQSVKSTVQRTIKEVLREHPVGTMEDSVSIYTTVEERCREELETFGVKLVNTNIFRLRPVDASILRGIIDPDSPTPDSGNDGNAAKVVTIAQQNNL